ncbi:hypothetical protein BH10PSE18_BH10PSE18_11380 [soil metagenome]
MSQETAAALRFNPCSYIRTPGRTSPAGVVLHFADRLKELLSDEDAPRTATRQREVAGVLTATAMYADALRQFDMSRSLQTLRVDDTERLLALGDQLTQLGRSLHPSSDATGELLKAPDLGTVLQSHYVRILESDNVTRQATQAHALVTFLGSTDAFDHESLKQACLDYLKHDGPLQAVIDRLFDTICSHDPTLRNRQLGSTPKTLIERTDVRRNLLLAHNELANAGSGLESAKTAANLASWLRQLDPTGVTRNRPLAHLRDACDACRDSGGSAATVKVMRDALTDCLAAVAIAADQNNLGPDLSNPANAQILNQQACAYADLIKNAGTAYLMSFDKMVTVIERWLSDPTSTAANVAAQSRTSVSQVGEVRGSLRNHVATSLSDVSRRNLVACALYSAHADDFRKSSSRLLEQRLVNSQAWSAWKEMQKRFDDEFPNSLSTFLELVENRDSSLLRFIPENNAFAGVLYAHLFQTDPRYCKSIESARDDLMRVRHAAGLTAAADVAAAPNA